MRRPAEVSRADAVRNRRREQTQKRIADSAMLATRPLAPITARRPAVMPTSSGPAASRVRRRSRPLRVPGIEIHLPSVKITGPQVKSRLLSTLLSLLLGSAIYFAWNVPEFRTAPALISGNQRIASDEINAALGSTGQLIFELVPARLETRLRQNFPELLAVRVSLGLPNQVFVTLQERKPVIVWQQGNGYTWIDDTGVAFRPHGTGPDLITVQALTSPQDAVPASADPYSPAPFIPVDLVQSIKILAGQAPAGTPLVFDSRRGLGWSDPRGWQVFLGSGAREMPLRLQVYRALVDMFEAKGIRPTFVGVQYPNAPYYRMNQ